MPNSPIAAVILAAGMGTRMKSGLPKVMHPVAIEQTTIKSEHETVARCMRSGFLLDDEVLVMQDVAVKQHKPNHRRIEDAKEMRT